MEAINPHQIGNCEDHADKNGTGSVFRACLAIQRACPNKSLGNLVMELGHSFRTGRDIKKHLETICEDHFRDASGEFREALQALKNALELDQNSGVEDREDLWFRLERLIS